MTSQTEPFKIDGLTLMLRIGHAPRGRISYFSPQTTIEEFLRHAAEHEGRLLFVGNFKSLRNKIGFNYLLLWSPQSAIKLVGTVTNFGEAYNPKTWNPKSHYQAPFPWGRTPANYWLALDNVQQLGDFDPDKFERLATTPKRYRWRMRWNKCGHVHNPPYLASVVAVILKTST